MVRAIIFDFDGVLADTELLHWAAFQEAVADRGIPLPRTEYFARYLGLPDRDCLVAVCADAGRPASPDEMDVLFHRKRAAFAPPPLSAGDHGIDERERVNARKG